MYFQACVDKHDAHDKKLILAFSLRLLGEHRSLHLSLLEKLNRKSFSLDSAEVIVAHFMKTFVLVLWTL